MLNIYLYILVLRESRYYATEIYYLMILTKSGICPVWGRGGHAPPYSLKLKKLKMSTVKRKLGLSTHTFSIRRYIFIDF